MALARSMDQDDIPWLFRNRGEPFPAGWQIPQCFIPKYFLSKSLAIQTIYEHNQKLLMQSELIY
jgi:hypothetical protein